MTTHYIDITLLPDPEFSHAHLLSALYAKLHQVLVQLQANDIGVSFPRYQQHPRTLGTVLRLHSSEAALARLMGIDWLKGMRDHIALTAMSPAPTGALHRAVIRRQFKTSVERLRRRRMLRKGETAEQAAAAIPDSAQRQPNLPFTQLHSATTGQRFCLFVEHVPIQASPQAGSFNCYGLSHGATVPWF
ncbi:type I-F CRISPR-associated endoribonuclease Cas6/Csy4 [Ramlibacter sp. H39-3-26]|uniref:type I-F CRISPR-associated endoribonuclease Cas6/Csy4 n=1 Tax=Curvibacter soli TaxID=3031331 RepID=UPI0023D9D44F|nr:type I-F CRISPR-associated endoribonuclease Cas6/Csy4 [Ramlibacter sp. H39-3-26]MDF1484518.1 type I-F CRISPR-associated endoribonuclease Cas6/Csy4 [Ramlibacter sp. H39-3-26]